MTTYGLKELDDAFEFLDVIFRDSSAFINTGNIPSCFTPQSSYPPVNVYVEQDSKNMVFEFAVAGIDDDRVSIDFKNDYMLFEIAAKKEEESDASVKYMVRGIRSSAVKSRYLVPASKYKHDEAKASVKDGILKVIVPSNPEAAPKKVPIKRE